MQYVSVFLPVKKHVIKFKNPWQKEHMNESLQKSIHSTFLNVLFDEKKVQIYTLNIESEFQKTKNQEY